MASAGKQPTFLIRKETSPEFKFRETKSEMLNWFYHLLAIEFRLEKDRVDKVLTLLSAWNDPHYEFSVLQELDHWFYDHPLLAMAFNVMVDSKKTFIRLKVPFTSTMFLNYFIKQNEGILKLKDDPLTQLYLTRQVERNAMKQSRFKNVLFKLLKQTHKQTKATKRDVWEIIELKDDPLAIYCRKLVVFYGYGVHWDELMQCMTDYLDQVEASKTPKDPKPKTPTKTPPEAGDENIIPGKKRLRRKSETTTSPTSPTSPKYKVPKYEEPLATTGLSPKEFPSMFSPKTPKEALTPKQRFVKNLCKMLQIDNRSLLQELKEHLEEIEQMVALVLLLVSHPRAPTDKPVS